MKQDLRKMLAQQILVGDGAMGTYLYQSGFPVGISYEEFNLDKPDIIMDVHRRYYEAGARLIETNTFSANRVKLSAFGLENELEAINRAGVALARAAVGEDAYVIGAVGSLRAGKRKRYGTEQLQANLEEQIAILLDSQVDGIMLETFYELEEIRIALAIVRKLSDLPVICQLATEGNEMTQDGVALHEAFGLLKAEGADVVGFNCHSGPNGIVRALEKIGSSYGPYSIFPNAGLPRYVDGRFSYHATPEYFAQTSLQFADLGARIIGGCCGTTPEHIAAIAQALKHYIPDKTDHLPESDKLEQLGKTNAAVVRETRSTAKSDTPGNTDIMDEKQRVSFGQGGAGQEMSPLAEAKQADESSIAAEEPSLLEIVKVRHTVIVELDPPRDLAIEGYMKAAEKLRTAGVDAITMADNSLAQTRMSNLSMGYLVKERLGMKPLLHITCRDRNMIGTQSHLMGLHALGINHLLAVTGDPARFGDLPGSSSVYDLNSFDLIRMIKQLNEGIAFSGNPLKQKAQFVIGAAFDPNVKYIDKAVQRMEKKIEAGADFFMTQPVYDIPMIERLYDATKHIKVPIFVGIMPLMSSNNAEFLHNEVPGISIREETRKRMAGLSGEAGREMGVRIAKELLDVALSKFNGIYIMTPMLFAGMSAELTQYIQKGTIQ